MGFLDRLMGRAGIEGNVRTHTTIKQKFSIKVPAANATAVQAGLERWAASKGWAAVVNAEREGDFVKFSFEHDESRPGKPPQIQADKMGEELQKILEDAVKPVS